MGERSSDFWMLCFCHTLPQFTGGAEKNIETLWERVQDFGKRKSLCGRYETLRASFAVASIVSSGKGCLLCNT